MAANLLMIGAQGSGKGTQAERLAARHGYVIIGTGDILRRHVKAGDELGKIVARLMEHGQLIGDAIMEQLLRDELARISSSQPVIIDGSPRTLPQAKLLERIFILEDRILPVALYLKVSRATIVRRLANRRVCPECGRIFGVGLVIKKLICPICKIPPIVRHDDRPEVIEQRLNLFFSQTLPMIDYYHRARRLLEIDGEGTIEEVTALIERGLGLSHTTTQAVVEGHDG